LTDLSNRVLVILLSAVALVGIVSLAIFEPITRHVISTDAWCTYCHEASEYSPDVRMPFTTVHPPAPEEGEYMEIVEADNSGGVMEGTRLPAQCIDCHLPEGLFASAYAYTHYLSVTDLFGNFRDREGERSGDWIPMSAARAYRVRDRLFENDSNTCRSCHVEEEIEPQRKRGKRAHKSALEDGDTCIECHNNLVHRYIELRDDAFERPEAGE
jgi:trimethylamine-N-oxide reductase cytochrome c-type subunit TorC